ncbi:hypothetical protein B0H16DRAFT_1484237 [Mycena metata]|uniref:Uncharacterized protein n=1 Tax=Mycena metata TaxID=1033252 RepID=A0AAD7DT87_9AGAR|nr:hypothetical protein B0H16DRAFT_1484237 [Mycena metata]
MCRAPLRLVIQGQYPGALGWTHDKDKGFSVSDDNRDAWKIFVKAHAVFKPFANEGWDLFDLMHDILPTRAKASLPAPGVSQFQAPLSQLTVPDLDNDFPSASQLLSFLQSQSQSSQSQLTYKLQGACLSTCYHQHSLHYQPPHTLVYHQPLVTSCTLQEDKE